MPFKKSSFSSLFLPLLTFPTIRSADGDDEEEVVHMGNAIMSFYSALIDLLGRCAPEMHVCLIEIVNFFFLSGRFSLFSLHFMASSAHQQGER